MTRGGYYSVDSLKGVHVLLIEDAAAGRDLLVSILGYCGGLVTAVPSSADALAVMGLIRPDVILTALDLQIEDGYAVLRGVRDLKPEDGGVIPLVAIAKHDPTEAERARQAGFNACLLKPLDPWELCRVISSLTIAP